MSVSTTANLGLTLPYQTDPVAVSEQNSNMGLIDGFAGDEWANMGIVETGVTATHAIAAGQYVIWKGILYTADSAISVGTTLSRGGSGSSGTKNLTAVSNGGFNALNSNLTNVSSRIAGEAVAQTTIHAFMKSCKKGISIGNYYYAKSDNPPSTLDWNTIIVVFKVNEVNVISGSDYCLFLYPGKVFLGRPDASEITWYPLN